MRFTYKRLTILPILTAVFLLGITVLSSYFVINQGTGGFKSRAESACSSIVCDTGNHGRCATNTLSNLYCNYIPLDDKFMQGCFVKSSLSSNNYKYNVKYWYNCPSGTACYTGTSCSSGICTSGKCALRTTSQTTSPVSSPTCGTSGRACCPPAGHVGKYYCQSGLYASSQTSNCNCSSTAPTNKDSSTSTTSTTTTTNTSNRTNTGGSTGGGGTVAPPTEEPPAELSPTEVSPAVENPPESTSTTGNATLNFALKFQGVNGNPRGAKSVPFKVKLKGPTKTTDYVAGTLSADSDGKWKGSVTFTGIELGPNVKYTIYTKAGKHLQKRVCDPTPTETSGGLYNQSESNIVLNSGENNLDFTGIYQLVGDLPSQTGEQDGIVDSYEVTYVLGHLRSTQPDELAIGDLNFDGIIDTQDRSLIIQSLNVKYDDE